MNKTEYLRIKLHQYFIRATLDFLLLSQFRLFVVVVFLTRFCRFSWSVHTMFPFLDTNYRSVYPARLSLIRLGPEFVFRHFFCPAAKLVYLSSWLAEKDGVSPCFRCQCIIYSAI